MPDIHPAFKLKQSKAGDWYFNIVAANNKILATSEMYKAKASAENGIKSVIENTVSCLLDEDGAKTVPSRSALGVSLAALNRMGMNSMIDVAEALSQGRLNINE